MSRHRRNAQIHSAPQSPLKGAPFKLDQVTIVNVRDVSDEQERRIGYVMDAVLQDLGQWSLEADHPATVRVNYIGQRLARVSDRPNLGYTFKVINDHTWANAVSYPGGFVYVSMGLLNLIDNNDELAAVLAHEIGHIAARHGIKQEQRAQLLAKIGQISIAVVSAAASVVASQYAHLATDSIQVGEFAGRAGAGVAGGLATTVADVFVRLTLSKHSREAEREADTVALSYLEKAGYPAKGVYSLLSKLMDLAAREGVTEKGMFTTHPPTEERLDTIQQYLTGQNQR